MSDGTLGRRGHDEGVDNVNIAALSIRERPAQAAGRGDLNASWNTFVARAPGGDLIQTTAWGDSKRAVGLRPRLVVVKEPGGTILGGALMILKRFGPRLWVASVARGPLVVRDDADLAARVVDRMLESARQAGVRLAIVQPPEGSPAVEQALIARGLETGCPSIAPEATIRLDLRQSDEDLLAAMRRDRRRNLRHRRSAEIVVETSEDVALLQRLHARTAERQGFTPLSEETLRAQWDALAPSGACFIMVARYEDEPLCACLLTFFAGTATIRILGWDREATERVGAPRSVSEVLYWEASRWARASGAHTQDLGGIDREAAESLVEGHPLPEKFSGTPASFKYGFGGQAILQPRARWVALGRLGTVARPAIRRALASPRATTLASRSRNG